MHNWRKKKERKPEAWTSLTYTVRGQRQSYSTSRPPVLKICPILPGEEMLPVRLVSWSQLNCSVTGLLLC